MNQESTPYEPPTLWGVKPGDKVMFQFAGAWEPGIVYSIHHHYYVKIRRDYVDVQPDDCNYTLTIYGPEDIKKLS